MKFTTLTIYLFGIFLYLFFYLLNQIGSITGGANYSFNKLNLTRKYIFPLYKISELMINLRGHYIFSTDLLKKYLSQNTIKKSKFNYILNLLILEKKI